MTVEEQESQLTALVEEYRKRECRNALEKARGKAARLTRQAYKEAREHLHQAVVKERRRAIARIHAAQAELQTKRRLHAQRAAFATLETGWEQLESRLRECWEDEAGRKSWTAAVIREAWVRLPRQEWLVYHPTSWPAEEILNFARDVSVSLEHPPGFRPDPAIEAGLIVASGTTSLNVSLRGLLADRGTVEARLLALMALERQP